MKKILICKGCGHVQKPPKKKHIANRYEEEFGPACEKCAQRHLVRYRPEKHGSR